MRLQVPQAIVDRIERQARREAPLECCGYLGAVSVGNSFEIKEAYLMTNVDRSPTHYSLEPEEQFAVVRRAREQGLEIAAVYHSHPESAARMSEEDLRLAYDETKIFLIYSIPDRNLRGYRIKDHQVVAEVPVQIMNTPVHGAVHE